MAATACGGGAIGRLSASSCCSVLGHRFCENTEKKKKKKKTPFCEVEFGGATCSGGGLALVGLFTGGGGLFFGAGRWAE